MKLIKRGNQYDLFLSHRIDSEVLMILVSMKTIYNPKTVCSELGD